MGSFSIWHWLIVLVVVALLFGGKGRLSNIMDPEYLSPVLEGDKGGGEAAPEPLGRIHVTEDPADERLAGRSCRHGISSEFGYDFIKFSDQL